MISYDKYRAKVEICFFSGIFGSKKGFRKNKNSK